MKQYIVILHCFIYGGTPLISRKFELAALAKDDEGAEESALRSLETTLGREGIEQDDYAIVHRQVMEQKPTSLRATALMN